MSPADRSPYLATGRRAGLWLCCLALGLSWFVLRTYQRVYRPAFGWTKLISFGADFTPTTTPLLRQTPHYVDPDPGNRFGYDGQFYAQLALDPSLRHRDLDHALDSPAYRARRIGVPFLSYCLGLGKPWWILQAYALANLLFWFVLLAALSVLFRPWTGQQLLCLAACLLSYGVIASLMRALIDLPATALIFGGAAIGSWGGYAMLAAAALTRETSLLAAFGFLEERLPWQTGTWKKNLGLLALVIVPLGLWAIYVGVRFHGLQDATGQQNFGWPLKAMLTRLVERIQQCAQQTSPHRFWTCKWLYRDWPNHEWLTITAIFVQGLFFVLRRNVHCRFWRTGVCYVGLCCVLGPAVWDQTSAAARVLLPMTVCFYLVLARESAAWFWPFFILGSLSIPYGVHDFWMLP